MATKAQRIAERDAAIARLKALLPEGSVVFHVTRSVSRSGMSRRVDYFAFHQYDGQPSKLYLTGYMAKALGLRFSDDGISTYSADDPIYHLSYKLFGTDKMRLRAERI